ncbi:FAD-dependent oxidoreductase [Labrenzia sp. OB1]|uniref:NAD(P)/FAD-dependent oxidoreductase n=1 Tax=Labrenzia sp. OB1 TaxID=1561204 RepID=UPI0007B2D52E|nr:FAD-dependent oxidoreductase [Labrenzia sp. OB1]KZM49863.1 NADH-ubiquinone oxidoreductase subunit 6 [Labrenzia sp. OB1]
MRIAVIGSGISGNSAAWALSHSHDVVLYEKRMRPGGHSATADIDYDGTELSVDTGFIVYNELNYPNFTALLDHLGVANETSDMSFALSADNGALEWSGHNLNGVFAQRKNLVSPKFLRMLRDIFRFNKRAVEDLKSGSLRGQSLGGYLAKEGYSRGFINDYLLAMGAAIWSTPIAEMHAYPAESFVAFFENHRLLSFDRPRWRTVSGGSRHYVDRLLAPLKDRIRLATPVVEILRQDGKVIVCDTSGNRDVFDHVVLAGHTDQSLAMLGDPSDTEREILGSIRYRPNEVYLHRDENLMPRSKRVWASWNYLSDREAGETRDVTVSYWMNRLQNIDPGKPVFVTLNPFKAPREDRTFAKYVYDHPQFDASALAAQKRLSDIQGIGNTWFCGAWTGNGFHEDGLKSGLAVARALGARVPWEEPEAPCRYLDAAE